MTYVRSTFRHPALPKNDLGFTVDYYEGALSTLSPRDQEVLLLWDAGLSYPEIAAQTGLAVGAVGTTLARARKRLIEAYERKEYQANAARS